MRLPPKGTEIRVIWEDASSDLKGWHYSYHGPFAESEGNLTYATRGLYLGLDGDKVCLSPGSVVDDDGDLVAAGDRWWIPLGCIHVIEVAKYSTFSRKAKRKA